MWRMSVKNKKIWDWIVWIQDNNELVNNLCDWLKNIVKTNQKLLNIYIIKKLYLLFFCTYKIVDISAETWNKAGVSVIRVYENDDVNKSLLLLLYVSDISKRWGDTNIYERIDK